MSAPQRLEVGRVGRPHGLTGEVTVTFSTNREERHEVGAVLYADDRRLVVTAARPHQHRWLLRFEGVTDRDEAIRLRGARLRADPLEAEDDPDEWWVHELIGAEVVDRAGRPHGRVASVEANPAHDLLVLDGGALVPVVFIVEHGAGRVVVDPPVGLLEG
ncbi:MAG TPA: ribosome maturation factor RimM [Acidimicrobiia bacterium]|nr:ribosome maturation factor RimM [Acidimicrobiia bacterium]